MTADDMAWMQRALALARETAGLASPNPQVGCVLVQDGHVLGEGAHRYAQRDHAEIVALKQAATAGHDVRGVTAYVTLEPCSHQGRTGPCADALIAAGVARVVVATVDPNPQVSGRGIQKLRAAGIAVEVGVLEAEARRMNDAFALSITLGRPFVTLKAALSVDGHLAPAPASRKPGEPFWLTGAGAREEVHRMRNASDAILTGIGTVLADDPLLNDRSGLPRRRPLLRVVLDSKLRTPVNSKLVESANDDVCVFTSLHADGHRRAQLASHGGELCEFSDTGAIDLAYVLERLHERQITSVLLEGGSRINGAFLAAGLVDRVVLFYAETELGADALPFAQTISGQVSPFALEQQMLNIERRSFGADVMIAGNLRDPWASASPARASSR